MQPRATVELSQLFLLNSRKLLLRHSGLNKNNELVFYCGVGLILLSLLY